MTSPRLTDGPLRSERGVIEVLRERLASNSIRGQRTDGHTVALALEGGGLRGVVSAAMATVIEELGVLDAVDLLVGTSAGAVNAAALCAGTIDGFSRAYIDTFSERRFIDPRRALTAKPVIRLDRLIDYTARTFGVSHEQSKHDLQLAFVATSLSTAKTAALTDFSSNEDFRSALAASGLLPLLGGPPVALRDDRWLDGGLVEPIPVATAAELGASHVLVLATRPDGARPGFSPLDVLIERYLTRLNRDLGLAYRGRPAMYAANVQSARQDRHPVARTLVLSPDPSAPIPSRLERDEARLADAHAAARERARTVLLDADLVAS